MMNFLTLNSVACPTMTRATLARLGGDVNNNRKTATLYDYISTVLLKKGYLLPVKGLLPTWFVKLEKVITTKLNVILDVLLERNFDEFEKFIHSYVKFHDIIRSLPHKYTVLVLDKLILLAQNGSLNFFNDVIHSSILHLKICFIRHLCANDKTAKNILYFNIKQLKTLPIFITFIKTRTLDDCYEKQIFGISSATTKISDLADKFSNVLDKVDIKVNDLSDDFTSTMRSLQHAASAVSSSAAINIVSVSENILESIKKNIIALTAQVYAIYNATNKTSLLLALVPIPTLLGLDIKLSEIFTNLVDKFFVKQNNFDSTKRMLMLLFTCWGRYSPSSLLASFTSKATASVKDMEAMEKIWEMFSDVLSEFGLDVSSKAKAVNELRSQLGEVLDKTPHFETLCATKTVAFLREAEYKDFMHCYDLVCSIKKNVDTGTYNQIKNSNFCADLMNLNMRYLKMKKSIDEVRSTNGTRQEPIAICFVGIPGIGKSQLATNLSTFMSHHYNNILKADDSYSFMSDIGLWSTWNQNVADDYHQGYRGQQIHYVDDLFSRADEEDHKDILNFISPAVFPTRQAELSQKGFPYGALLLVASSNQFPTTSKVLKCVSAVHRRFIVVDCSLKPGCRVPSASEFDPSFKHLNMRIMSGIDYVMRKNTDTLKSSPLSSLPDLLNIISKGMRTRAQMFESGFEFRTQSGESSNPISNSSTIKITHGPLLKTCYNILYCTSVDLAFTKGLGLNVRNWIKDISEKDINDLMVDSKKELGHVIILPITETTYLFNALTASEEGTVPTVADFMSALTKARDYCLGLDITELHLPYLLDAQEPNFSLSYVRHAILSIFENSGIDLIFHISPHFPHPIDNCICIDGTEELYFEKDEEFYDTTVSLETEEICYQGFFPHSSEHTLFRGPVDFDPELKVDFSAPFITIWPNTQFRDLERQIKVRYGQNSKLFKAFSKLSLYSDRVDFVENGTEYLRDFMSTRLQSDPVSTTAGYVFEILQRAFWISDRAQEYIDLGIQIVYIEPESYKIYSFKTHSVNRVNQILHVSRTETVILEEDFWEAEYKSKLEEWNLKISGYYATFAPILRTVGMYGFASSFLVCPPLAYILMSLTVAVIGLRSLPEEWLNANCFFTMYCELFYDLLKLAPYIVGITTLISMVLYKYKTFGLNFVCVSCKKSADLDAEHNEFCKRACRNLGVGRHQESCREFIQYYAALTVDDCVACKRNKCESSNCYHNQNVTSLDECKLIYYKNKVFGHQPEASFSGEKQKKIKMKFEASFSGEKQKKIKHLFKPELGFSEVDIFNKDHNIVQCISADLAMSRGFALKVVKWIEARRREEDDLHDIRLVYDNQPHEVGDVVCYNNSDNTYIFSLITKEKCDDKPTLENFKSCVIKLVELVEEMDVTHLDIPYLIGTGRDKLKKSDVQPVLKELLVSEDLKVKYYKPLFDKEYDGTHTPGKSLASDIIPHSKITLSARKQLESYRKEITHDNVAVDLWTATTARSIRCFSVGTSNNNRMYLYGHGFNNYIVTPNHLYISSDPNRHYFFHQDDREIQMYLVKSSASREIALWRFDAVGKSKPFCRGFYKNLITEADFTKVCGRRLVALQHIPTRNMMQVVELNTVQQERVTSAGIPEEYERLFYIKGLSTLAPVTNPGDCGGLIVAYNTLLTRKIMGFHVIGGRFNAYSAILTKEVVDELLTHDEARKEGLVIYAPEKIIQSVSAFPIVDVLNLIPDEIIGTISKNMPEGDFEYLGESQTFHRPASVTSLKKHPLHGTFDVVTHPAILSNKELLDIHPVMCDITGEKNLLVDRGSVYGKVYKNKINTNILDNMVTELSEYFTEILTPYPLEPADDDVVLNGDEFEIDSHPIDFRTSAGVPWSGSNENHAFKKQFFVDSVEEVNSLGNLVIKRKFNNKPETRVLLETIETTETLARKGIRVCSLVKNCLKDEPRPIEKVHKPRLFKVYPFDKVLLMRKYFLNFKTAWTKERFSLFHAVGINCISTEWTTLYNKLAGISNIGCDADFGSFDANLRAEFMDAANLIIINTICKVTKSEENRLLMRVLLDEGINTINVSGKTIYIDKHGNPSGSPLTTVINCIVNLLYHWYAFIRITEYTSLHKFQENVSFFSFGDDVIMTAKSHLNYNFDTIADILINELEQDYTTASKENSKGMRPLTELTFLKRKFRLINGCMIFAPILQTSIEQRLNWTIIPDNDFLTHRENLEEALIEAAAHGVDYFNQFRDKIKIGIRRSQWRHDVQFMTLKPSFSDYHIDLMRRYV